MRYIQSETTVIRRSQINFAPYNPKRHSKEAISEQAKNIKRVGILGGIVWNRLTGNLVSGHKRIMALDKLNKYDGAPEKDYGVKVEAVEMDEKTEKEQNVYMDAAATNTAQDVDLLAELIPQIDYKNAGLTEVDLNIIGIDYVFETEEESSIVADFDDLMSETNRQKEAEKQERKAAVKAMKDEIKRNADEKARNMDAYVMISFETHSAKAAFMQRFDFDKREKYIKGEVFSEMIERIE